MSICKYPLRGKSLDLGLDSLRNQRKLYSIETNISVEIFEECPCTLLPENVIKSLIVSLYTTQRPFSGHSVSSSLHHGIFRYFQPQRIDRADKVSATPLLLVYKCNLFLLT